jgi:geranylgeranyl reductase
MALRTQVLVVGGGPAGSTAARVLSRSGMDVILIEKDLHHKKPCGGGIPSTAFNELDIPLDIAYRSIDKIRIISPSDRRLDITLKGGSILIVDRREFDSKLRKIAEDSGVKVIEGSFLDLESKNGKIVSRITLKGEKEVVESDYLVAADGVNSRIKMVLGVKPASYIYTLSGGIKGIETDACEFWYSTRHALDCYSWVFPVLDGSSGPSGMQPSTGCSSHVGVGAKEIKDARVFYKRFLQRLSIDQTDQKAPRGYKIPVWSNDTYNIGNILFAGDSAGQTMPFTYEGIYYSMKSGEFAAEAIINKKPSSYKKLWQKRFLSRFRLMNALRKVFLNNDEKIELLFNIFSRPEVQEASMKLWLHKDTGRSSILSYAKFFGKFLR